MLNSMSLFLAGAVLLLVLCAISVGVSLFYFRRARLAPYHILREAARKRGLWCLLVGLILLILSLLLLYLNARSAQLARPTPAPSAVPTTTFTPTPTETPPASPTPTLSVSPSATPTRRPTATPPFIPTPTPAYPLPDTALSPLPDATPAGPDAQIVLLTLALAEENGRPVGQAVEFAPGDHRVYLFFDYVGMTNNLVWTYGWYRDGQYLDGATRLWVLGGFGDTYLYFKPPGGYEPGMYEIRVWIEDTLQGVAQFVITEQ
jgi:hypothetical protein